MGDPLGHLRVGFPSPVLWWGPPSLHPHPKATHRGNETAGMPPSPPKISTHCTGEAGRDEQTAVRLENLLEKRNNEIKPKVVLRSVQE